MDSTPSPSSAEIPIASTLPDAFKLLITIAGATYYSISTILYTLSYWILIALYAIIKPLIIVCSAPVPLLLYILSPVITLGKFTSDTFVVAPYHAVVDLAEFFYPVYVFIGIAVIVGMLLGGGARLAILSVNHLAFGSTNPTATALEKRGPPTPAPVKSEVHGQKASRKKRVRVAE